MGCGRWWCRRKALGASGLFLVASIGVGVTAWGKISPSLDAADSSPSDDRARPVMVALGDSFMAGEGTGTYLRGTSTPENTCHRSSTAYPYRAADELGFRLVFAACSGAVTADIEDNPKFPNSPDDVLGGQPQIQLLTSSDWHDAVSEVDVVVISIGGNDAGFGDIVRTCLQRDCELLWQAWIDDLEDISGRLDAVYDLVAQAVEPGTRVLVTTYPAPIIDAPCGALGEQLSITEVRWVLQRFLPRLNYLISFQASVHGFELVEMQDLFAGARLCEVPYEQAAVNAFALQRIDRQSLDSLEDFGPLSQGSFHPNVRGHALMTEAVLQVLRNEAPPTSLPGSGPPLGCPPDITPDACLPPDTPPPNVPIEVGVPFDEPVPEGTACRGIRDELTAVVILEPDQHEFDLMADADTMVCSRAQLRDWEHETVPRSGSVDISTDPILEDGSAAIEIYFTRGSDDIDKVVLYPPNGYTVEPRPDYAIGPTNKLRMALLLLWAVAVLLVVTQMMHCLRCRFRRS